LRSALATAASAVAYALLFAPLEWAALSWVALVPLFLAVRNARPLAAAGLGALFGVITTACIVAWLVPTLNGHFERSLAWSVLFLLIVSVLAMAPYLALALGLWARARDRLGPVAAPLLLAAAWVASELARTHLGIGSAWTLLGDAHYDSEHLRQLAALTGVYGVSGLVAFGNVALAEGVVAARCRLRGLAWNAPALRVSACGFGVLAVAVWMYGDLRLQSLHEAPEGARTAALELAVVQGNVPAELRWKRTSISRFLRRYTRLTRDALRGRPERPTLVIWPENTLQTTLDDPTYGRIVRGLPFEDVSFLIGAPRIAEVDGHRRHHNSALLLRPDRSVEYYDKRRLLPFSETKPFGWAFRLGTRGDLEPDAYAAGTRPGVMRVADTTLGVLICMEALYPDLAREAARAGAEVLVNLSNDGWYRGRGGARQHLAQVVFRAVETGLPLVRSTTTGISALVTPDGAIVAQIGDGESDFLRVGLPAALPSPTFYVRFGDWFALACLAACLLAAALPRRRSLPALEAEQPALRHGA
jgi:apolipoprotein N-acyltransferase